MLAAHLESFVSYLLRSSLFTTARDLLPKLPRDVPEFVVIVPSQRTTNAVRRRFADVPEFIVVIDDPCSFHSLGGEVAKRVPVSDEV